MSVLPQTQKAWVVTRRGHPSVALELRKDYPVPSPKPGNVIVKIEAAALNPVGYKIMTIVPNFLVTRPTVAEHDFTGVVVNANGTSFKDGDKVFGIVPAMSKTGQGALSEYTSVPEEHLAPRPSNISIEEAAGIALVGQTAWEALFDVAHVEPGQSVFVNGGSSAVGISAIQLLKAKNCKVYASCSTKNVEFVKSLGADVVLDYTTKPLHEQLVQNPPSPKFHTIFDCVGGSTSLFNHSGAYLAPNGTFVAAGSKLASWGDVPAGLALFWHTKLRPTWLGGTNRTFQSMMMATTKDKLLGLSTLVQEGKLHPVVDSVYAFEDALKAYDKLMSHQAKGKLVITVP